MKNGARILCFNLSTLLFVLLTALPAFAQNTNLNITVNEGGTLSGVYVAECGNDELVVTALLIVPFLTPPPAALPN